MRWQPPIEEGGWHTGEPRALLIDDYTGANDRDFQRLQGDPYTDNAGGDLADYLLEPGGAVLIHLGLRVFMAEPETVLDVAGVTNGAFPIVYTTAMPHDLSDGDVVDVYGVQGTLDANSTFVVKVLSATAFSRRGTDFRTGVAPYSGGGKVVLIPRLQVRGVGTGSAGVDFTWLGSDNYAYHDGAVTLVGAGEGRWSQLECAVPWSPDRAFEFRRCNPAHAACRFHVLFRGAS